VPKSGEKNKTGFAACGLAKSRRDAFATPQAANNQLPISPSVSVLSYVQYRIDKIGEF
jgi:hypothetical protein